MNKLINVWIGMSIMYTGYSEDNSAKLISLAFLLLKMNSEHKGMKKIYSKV